MPKQAKKFICQGNGQANMRYTNIKNDSFEFIVWLTSNLNDILIISMNIYKYLLN